jgi:hypothetical protein
MNRQSWLRLSLCLNVLLAGVVVWAAKSRVNRFAGTRVSELVTGRAMRMEARTNEASPAVLEVNAPFHWRQVESADYRVYIENLRAIGCPELTIYDIVSADVAELFNGKIKELVDDVTGRFWNLIVKPHDLEKLVNEKEKELNTLRGQKDEMMTALFGEKSPADKLTEEEKVADKLAYNKRALDFLSQEKFDKVVAIQDHYEAARDSLYQSSANLSPKERQDKFQELEAQRLRDLQATLAPKEYEEYRLRTGDAAGIRDRLANFEGTEEEFRAVALAKLDSKGDEPIRQLLGPEKFDAYQRSLDNDYQQTLRITERFELPEATALQIYQMQKEAQAQAKKIRDDKSRAVGERQAILQAMQSESEKSISAALGATEFKAYQKYNGAWMEQLAGDVP